MRDKGFFNFVNGAGSSSAPTPMTCKNNNCSMQPIIESVVSTLQSELNKESTPNNFAVVPGTGQTCAMSIRMSTPAKGLSGSKLIGTPATGAILNELNAKPASDYENNQVVGTLNDGTVYSATKQCYEKIQGLKATTYKPIAPQHYQNSWWYGSEVYLDLNSAIANKIKNVVKQMKSFDITSNSFNMGAFTGTKTTNINMTEVIRSGWGAVVLHNGTNPDAYIKHIIPVSIPTSNNLSVLGMPSWSDLTCIFQPTTTGGFLDQNNCKLPSYIKNLASTKNTTSINAVGDANFYEELKAMPVEYQNPIRVLLVYALMTKLPYQEGYDNQLAYIQGIKTKISNIIRFLQYNHIYPGSATPSSGVSNGLETSAGRDILMTMFNKVLGYNTAGSAGISQFGGIIHDIYSLGNTQYANNYNDPSSNNSAMSALLANSFSSIAKAQRVGLEMINTVVAGFQNVYAAIKSKADGYIQTDTDIYQNAESYVNDAKDASYAAGIPIAGQIAQGVADIYKLKVMGDQIELQNQLVSQNYSMSELLMWLPLIITAMTSLFVAGVSFAIIVPVTPFILFWAGQIAWILSVLEAIVAAPLLVLAYTIPGGHEHFGHTTPGLRILIGVVLRPVLMVIGLVVGMILTYTLIHFSSQAFQAIVEQILSFSSSLSNNSVTYMPSGDPTKAVAYAMNASITQGILSVLLLLMFCSFMVMAFNKCFSTIYYIPEKVLAWIGGQMEKAGAQEAQQLSSSVTQNAEKGAGSAGQTLSQGGQAQAQHMQQSGQAESANANTGLQMAGTAADASQQFSKGAQEAASAIGGDPETGGGSVDA